MPFPRRVSFALNRSGQRAGTRKSVREEAAAPDLAAGFGLRGCAALSDPALAGFEQACPSPSAQCFLGKKPHRFRQRNSIIPHPLHPENQAKSSQIKPTFFQGTLIEQSHDTFLLCPILAIHACPPGDSLTSQHFNFR
jgi:hypothetical protein